MFVPVDLPRRFGLVGSGCSGGVDRFHVDFSVVSGHSVGCCDNSDRNGLFSHTGGTLRFWLDTALCSYKVCQVHVPIRRNSKGCYYPNGFDLSLLQVLV